MTTISVLEQDKTSSVLIPEDNARIEPAAESETIYAPYVDFTLEVHWDNEKNDFAPVDLAEISEQSGVKNFVTAFIVANSNGSCQATWGGWQEYSVSGGFGKESIDNLRAIGGDIIMSFGGLVGTYLSQACGSVEELLTQYKQVISIYEPKHIDFDVEGSQVADTEAMSRMIDALLILQQEDPELKIGFTVQVAPKDGLNPNAKDVLRLAAQRGLRYDLLNLMTMDYGEYNNGGRPDLMGEHAKQSAQMAVEFLAEIYPERSEAELWSIIGITPMIGINDVIPERFTLEDARDVTVWSKEQGIHFLSAWSINRDHSCNVGGNPVWTCSGAYNGVPMQTADWQYSQAFMS